MIRSLQCPAWFLGVLLSLAAACTSTAGSQAEWREIEVEAPSDRMVWQLILLALQSQNYPLAGGTDSGAREVESGWKTDMQPFKGEGKRRRAIVRLAPLEPGRWKLEARVKCEHNENLVSPLDPVRAQWESAPDDQPAAQVLLMHIRSRLQPEIELSPEKKAPFERDARQ